VTIGSLSRVLLHRWYLTLVVLALVAWFARGAWNQAEPQYETSTTFLVTPSVALSTPQPELPQGTQPGPSNPFSLSGGATTLAQTVSTALNTDTVQAAFMGAFPDAQFTAAEASSSSGSKTYFTVTASTTTPAEGGAVLGAALGAAAQQLLDVQHAVQAPDNALFIVIQSTPVDGPVESYPDRARAVGAVALGGLAAGVVLIVLLDLVLSGIGGALRRRREGSEGAAVTPADPAADEPEDRVDVRERAGSTSARRP
jgi:hypothetical protein